MVEENIRGKRKNVFFVPLLAAVFFTLLFASARAESHVFDEGGLFTPQEIYQMEQTAEGLAQEYHMNVLLLTAAYARGMDSREIAEAFYEENGYTENGKRGGIVLLIDMDNRELNLTTYGDMIHYITDEREERIYDAAYRYASDGDYAQAMTAMLVKTGQYLKSGIPGNQYTYDEESGRVVRRRSVSGGDVVIALGFAFACAGAACYTVKRRYRSILQYEYSMGQNADIRITGQQDHLVNQYETVRRIPRTQPPGGGRSGSGTGSGRTTVHRSSGGHSVGGGHGRKF